jgi:hypothetical protein
VYIAWRPFEESHIIVLRDSPRPNGVETGILLIERKPCGTLYILLKARVRCRECLTFCGTLSRDPEHPNIAYEMTNVKLYHLQFHAALVGNEHPQESEKKVVFAP